MLEKVTCLCFAEVRLSIQILIPLKWDLRKGITSFYLLISLLADFQQVTSPCCNLLSLQITNWEL